MWFVGVIVLLVLDVIWLSLMARMYRKSVFDVQGYELQTRLLPAFITYALLVTAFVSYVYPVAKRDVNKNVFSTALKYGGLFGFLVYGIYNFTCLSIYRGCAWPVAIIDTIWGTALFTVVLYITLMLETEKRKN